MVDLPIDCPRCSSTLEARVSVARRGGRPVRADVCRTCAGVWLDEYELAEVDGALGGLPFRHDEIARLGTVHDGTPRCPRCRDRCVEIAVLDVAVDVCTGCRGVWLDGAELEAVRRASDLEAARKAETTASYRVAPKAARAIADGCFVCPRCDTERPVSFGLFTPRGLVCRECFHEHDEGDLLAEASRDHGDASDHFRAARPGSDAASRVAEALVGALRAIATAARSTVRETCPACGLSPYDPGCNHR